MAKKRRTLEQKKRAALRQSFITPEQTISTSSVYSLKDVNVVAKTANATIHSNNSTSSIAYQYAFPDIRKTFFTTTAIVIAQIVLLLIVNK